jgi:hypothetical protein
MDDAIWASVDYLRQIFAIILALAVTEAFRQFIADRAETPSEPAVRRDAIWGLISFLFLLFPFYHGMARYLYDNYRVASSRPQPYSHFLLFDVVAFTVESALFFVMSRSIRLQQWRRFYVSVVAVLVIDTVWGTVAWRTHSPQVGPWLLLNIIFLPVFIAILLLSKPNSKLEKAAPYVAALLMVLRTVLDYALSWKLYFPS